MSDHINNTQLESSKRQEPSRYSYLIAYLILIISLLVFLTTISGIADELSNKIGKLLHSNLGYTNRWSTTYGPDWFIYINDDISALAGMILLPLFIILISVYYILKQRHKELKKFVFIVVGGIIFMIFLKVLFSNDLSDKSSAFINNSISSFPSGHAMLGTIFYVSLAVIISRKQRREKVKKFLLIFSVIIVILIGLSRFITWKHTFTEVLAGWSSGLIWLTICWLLEQLAHKKGLSEAK